MLQELTEAILKENEYRQIIFEPHREFYEKNELKILKKYQVQHKINTVDKKIIIYSFSFYYTIKAYGGVSIFIRLRP